MQPNRGAIVYFYFVIVVLIAMFGTMFAVKNEAQQHTRYNTFWGYPVPFLGDYLTNIFRIKLGQEGKLLYENYYTNETTPSVVFEPVYNLVGILTKPFGIKPFPAYELFRLFTVVVFIGAISLAITRVFSALVPRMFTLLFFLSSTSLWMWNKMTDPWSVTEPTTYSDYFSAFNKIMNIKPHHLFALAIVICIFYLVSSKQLQRVQYLLLAVLSILLGFLHPYISMYTGIFVTVFVAIMAIRGRAFPKHLVPRLILINGILIPIVVYHGYVLGAIWKAGIDVAGTLTWAPRGFSISTYLMALGIPFFLGLASLGMRSTYKNPFLIFLLIWGYVPLALFFLPDIGIPWGPYRMFQVYQLIPLSLLSMHVLASFFRTIRVPFVLGAGVVVFASIVYASFPFRQSYAFHTNPGSFYFYYQMIYNESLPFMSVLREKTQKGSVVLASEITSQFIPIEGHNKAMIAHPGTNPDFDTKMKDGIDILLGRIPPEQLQSTLEKYGIDYIVFGFDRNALPFGQTPYTTLPYLRVVYEQGSMSLVAVESIQARQ